MVIDNKLIKKYTKIWERVSILKYIDFDGEPVYGDNDKYVKGKYNHMEIKSIQFSRQKNTKRKCIVQMFVIDNARFCC